MALNLGIISHPRESGDLVTRLHWKIPAFAGMTVKPTYIRFRGDDRFKQVSLVTVREIDLSKLSAEFRLASIYHA